MYTYGVEKVSGTASYQFDWGDGSSTGWIRPGFGVGPVEATHKWSSSGYYNVKVKARNTFLRQSEWSIPLVVDILPDEPGKSIKSTDKDAVITDNGGPYEGFRYEPIDFHGSATGGTGVYDMWFWNFGDGNTAYEQNPTHTYIDTGTFDVVFTVRDTDGVWGYSFTTATIT